jgi:hypothetical protein
MLENHFIFNPSRFARDSAPHFSVVVAGGAVVVGVVTALVGDGSRWVNGVNVAVVAMVVMAKTSPTLVQKPSSSEIAE